MPSVSGVCGDWEAGLGGILFAGVARTRPKERTKHVDALRWQLSDGGSIPPASTNRKNLSIKLRFFSFLGPQFHSEN